MKHHVYVLQSLAEPSQIYTGLCTDVEQRLADHNSGKSPHTSKFKPWRLLFHCWFDDASKAAEFERYLKTGSGRAFVAKRIR